MEDEAVYPPSSVLIENPVAVVDAERGQALRPRGRRGVRRVPPHRRGEGDLHRRRVLRSTDVAEARQGGGDFPAIEDLWDVDDIGGWDALTEKLFGDTGIVTQAQAG